MLNCSDGPTKGRAHQESTSSECNDMIANIDVEIMDFAIIFVRIFFALNQIHVIVLQLNLWLNTKKRTL